MEEEEEMNQEVLSVWDNLIVPSASSPPPAATPLPASHSKLLTPPATLAHNWQAQYKGVRERNAVMVGNELMADVYFRVSHGQGAQSFPAHKYLLATGSSVFYAMFNGSFQEGSSADKVIDIPDVEPCAFLNMLRYIYTDKIELEADTVLATLYVAKKYIVPHLAAECVKFLETSLTAKNACILLSQSRLFEESDLMQRCWEVIDAQAEEALKSEGFTEIDKPTLELVLRRETLNAKEISLFDATVRWAEAQCGRQGIDLIAKNKREVLGNALYLIRVPKMCVEEFANGPAQSGILTLQEVADLFLYFTAECKPQLLFPCRTRCGLQQIRCHRFQSCAYRSNQWRYRGRCDSIQFSVDRRIFIAGFGLYGSSNGPAEYSVKIELKKNGVIMGYSCTKFSSDGSSNTFAIHFDNPIQIEPDTFYTASAILEGAELSYFGQEGIADVTVGKVTFQFQCSSDSTNGTGVQGGQIPELIFYC